jgi:hypothetical protein
VLRTELGGARWLDRNEAKEVSGAAHSAAHRANESRDGSRDQRTVPNAKDLNGPSGTVAGRSIWDRQRTVLQGPTLEGPNGTLEHPPGWDRYGCVYKMARGHLSEGPLWFFAIHSLTDLHILLLPEHPYHRTLRTLIPLVPFGRSLEPCESDSSDTPPGHHRLSQKTVLVHCIV